MPKPRLLDTTFQLSSPPSCPTTWLVKEPDLTTKSKDIVEACTRRSNASVINFSPAAAAAAAAAAVASQPDSQPTSQPAREFTVNVCKGAGKLAPCNGWLNLNPKPMSAEMLGSPRPGWAKSTPTSMTAEVLEVRAQQRLIEVKLKRQCQRRCWEVYAQQRLIELIYQHQCLQGGWEVYDPQRLIEP
jgi:hypothetical protein